MQLWHVDEVDVSTPQYQTILDGREEQHAGESKLIVNIPYTGKHPQGKTFTVFAVFHSMVNRFP